LAKNTELSKSFHKLEMCSVSPTPKKTAKARERSHTPTGELKKEMSRTSPLGLEGKRPGKITKKVRNMMD